MTEVIRQSAFGPVREQWLPPDLFKELRESVVASFEQQIRRSYILTGVDPDNRPTIAERRPLPTEYLDRRAEFAIRWEALVAEGEREGYLGHADCYECGGELMVTADTTEVVSVPNPDYDPDKPNPYLLPESGIITIPKASTQ